MYVYISEICQQETKLYQIEQKIEELANFTRKDKAEQFLNGLFREYRKTDNFYPHWVRQGYFKTEFACLGLNRTTEFWIEKY